MVYIITKQPIRGRWETREKKKKTKKKKTQKGKREPKTSMEERSHLYGFNSPFKEGEYICHLQVVVELGGKRVWRSWSFLGVEGMLIGATLC